MRANTIRALALLALLVPIVLSALPAEAADSLKMTVRPGLEGQGRIGAWLPVEVTVSNTGPDLNGEIQI